MLLAFEGLFSLNGGYCSQRVRVDTLLFLIFGPVSRMRIMCRFVPIVRGGGGRGIDRLTMSTFSARETQERQGTHLKVKLGIEMRVLHAKQYSSPCSAQQMKPLTTIFDVNAAKEGVSTWSGPTGIVGCLDSGGG